MNPLAIGAFLSFGALVNLVVRGEWLLVGGVVLIFVLSFLPGPAIIPFGIKAFVTLGSFYQGAYLAGAALVGDLVCFF